MISSAPHVDFGLDVVEVDGTPRAKRGKRSGRKLLWRAPDTGERRVLPANEGWPRDAGPPAAEPLLLPLLRDGRLVDRYPTAAEVRSRALAAVF